MAKKGGFPGLGGLGGLGMGGLQNMLMKQMQKVQEDQERIQAELDEARIDGSAGGGVVTATVSGKGEIVAVKIDPDAVDPDDVEMLEDLVTAAVKEAQSKASAFEEEKMKTLADAMPKIPGMPF